MKTKREINRDEKRIERAYYATCSGIAINVMDIEKVFKVGMESVDAGDTDEELRGRIKAFVNTIGEVMVEPPPFRGRGDIDGFMENWLDGEIAKLKAGDPA